MEIPFRQELENALRNAVICPVIANNSALTFAAREALRSATGIDLPFDKASNAIQASLCPLPVNAPVPPIPSGGQCPVNYRVDWSYTQERQLLNGDFETVVFNGPSFVLGPITPLGIQVVEFPTGSPCGNLLRQISYRVVNGQGNTIAIWSTSEFDCGQFVGNRRNTQPGTVAFSRVDQQPDNCGNSTSVPAPLPIPPGGLAVNPVTITSGNNSYSVSPKILVPFVNVQGELNIPVSVEIGGINVNFNLDLEVNFNVTTGDVKFEIGKPSGTRDPGKNTPRTPAPNSPITLPTDSEKEPKRKQVMIGAIVTVAGQSIPASLTAISLPGGTPTVFAPYLGYVNFVYQFANGDRAFSPDIPVKNRRQFIPSPEPQENVVNVIGSGNRGLNVVVTPVYKNLEVPR